MSIVIIEEENHGIIGCVASENDVIPFLTHENWVNQFTGIWNSFIHNFEPLKNRFGLNWFQELSKMNLDEISELFSYQFIFKTFDVWSVN